MAGIATFQASCFAVNRKARSCFRVRAQEPGPNNLELVPSDHASVIEAATSTEGREKNECLVDGGNGRLRFERKAANNGVGEEGLQPLWDDGYGAKTAKEFFEAARDILKPDDGEPPRWFCPVECGPPLRDSPLLLYLPGIDGIGMGLILHHKALGKAFEVRCLHIPLNDRTPFEELVQFVVETVRLENAMSPKKPIYLVGDSFGGCLALSVASHNPSIDLVLILVNPATSLTRSPWEPLFPVIKALPDGLNNVIPYLLGLLVGEPAKFVLINAGNRLPPSQKVKQSLNNLTALLPAFMDLANMVSMETVRWKLELLESSATYANSRLHNVKAEVLVLASGKDNLIPSRDEAQRLNRLLKNCTFRTFNDNGHILLLEDSISLLTILKGCLKYRCSRKIDFVSDFLPPSMTEYRYGIDQVAGILRYATGAIVYSTMEDGKIVRGLSGVPNEGPVLLIGNHMLLGVDVFDLVEAFIREKKIMVRGVAHTELFLGRLENFYSEFSVFDLIKVFGGFPVGASNLFKLLSAKSHVLLYPGGEREALHNKGEEYKLFWPDQQEFVRMAAKFGATIVPFATVGEDDIGELILDYHDFAKIPFFQGIVREVRRGGVRIRDEELGEVANQELTFPGWLPKMPGRFYYLFGKPIRLEGRKDLVKDKEKAAEVYLQIKSQVEQNLAYLLKKREEDPYRNIVDRIIYALQYAPSADNVPSFDP